MKSRIMAGSVSLLMAVGVGLMAGQPVAAQSLAAPVISSQVGPPQKPIYERVNGKLQEIKPSGKRVTTCPGTACFNYAWASKDVTTTTGTGATQAASLVSQHKPDLNATGCGDAADTTYHSLYELAIEDIYSPGGRNIVEVGWTVDYSLNGDCNPHLFAFHWVNGTPQGYAPAGGASGNGFIDNGAETTDIGDAVAYTAQGSAPTLFYQYMIERTTQCSGGGASGSGNGWRLKWTISGVVHILGAYCDTRWTSQGTSFTVFPRLDSFGELATVNTKAEDCGDLGSGTFGTGSLASAAKHKAMSVAGYPGATNTFTTVQIDGAANGGAGGSPTAWRIYSYAGAPTPDPDMYDWGGPGYNSSGTGTGSIGSC